MTHHWLTLVGVFFVSTLVCIFSGMSGSAGGILMTPFLIWMGLTPQQTIATGKFASFGLSIGALTAFRAKIVKEKKRMLVALIALSAIIGVIAALTFQHIDNGILQRLIGALMLLMIPVIWEEKAGLRRKKVSERRLLWGYGVLCAVLFLQGMLGGGIGTLSSVVFIVFFGTTALQANMLQRIVGIVLNIAVVAVLLRSSLIVYSYGIAAGIGALIGGYIGSKIALKQGNKFAKYALVIFMAIAGVALILDV
jgi:uncharacterized membrane protein YfcA